jgi:multiple sugar transport system substrate-binding protein
MKNSNLFQYVVMGLFVFFLLVGAILFSTFRSSSSTASRINISMWGTLPADSFSPFVAKYFNDSDLKYIVDYSQRNPDAFDRDLVEALASGVGPDAIILPTDLILRYSNKIYPIPYTTLPELTFKQTFIQEGELFLNTNGVLALPFLVDPLVMYWNRDIFNNASITKPPVTWSEISSLVPKMTSKDPAENIISSTIALGEFRNINNAKDIISLLFIQAGISIVGLDMGTLKSTMLDNLYKSKDLPASLALQFYTNFSNPNKTEYSWNRSFDNSLDVFTNGDSALYLGFASEYLTIKNKNPNLNFDVAVMPQASPQVNLNIQPVNTTFGNMLGMAIMRNSGDPAGAFTVLSTLTSAAAYPFWKDIFNLPSTRRDILSQFDASPVKTIFNRSAIISKGWLDPNRAMTSGIFQEMIESYTTGRDTLEGAINTASGRLDAILNQ